MYCILNLNIRLVGYGILLDLGPHFYSPFMLCLLSVDFVAIDISLELQWCCPRLFVWL